MFIAKVHEVFLNIFLAYFSTKNLLSEMGNPKGVNHRFLIEVDCSLVIKHKSKLNGIQTIQMSQVF
jgi:hypothetical protein